MAIFNKERDNKKIIMAAENPTGSSNRIVNSKEKSIKNLILELMVKWKELSKLQVN